MKKRLLLLFAVMLGLMVNGVPLWAQATGTPVKDVKELKAAISAASDGDVITLADGTFGKTDAIAVLSINKSITIQGKDTNAVTVSVPFDIEATGKTISFAGVHLSVETEAGRGVVDIKSGNTAVTFTECKITIAKAGTADSGPGACFGIVSQTGASVNNNTVNFIRSRMNMSKGYQRGLAFRDGYGHTVNFTDSQMDGPSGESNYSYVIGICSWPSGDAKSDPITYNIKSSKIDVNYYAIFTNNQASSNVPVVINIDKSEITAWSALYLRGDNVTDAFPHTVKITGTQLTGRSFFNGASDSFGTMVFDNCQQMDLTIDAKSSITSINKKAIENTPIGMYIADVRKKTAGTMTFIPNGGSKCLIQTQNDLYAPTLFSFDNSETSALKVTGIENVEFRDEAGKPCILINKADGSFRNASNSIATVFNTALAGDQILLPEGAYTLAKPLAVDKPLTIEGAGRDKTTINGSFHITATDKAKVNIRNLALAGKGNKIEIGTAKGTETPVVAVTDCKIATTDASGIRLLSKGAELALTTTDIDAQYYGIGVRNENQKVTINGGEITARAAIMTSAGGLTTGDGTLAKTNTSISVNGTTLIGRTIAKGEAESYGTVVFQEKYNGVTAKFTDCTLKTVPGIAGVEDAEKQMSAISIRSYGNTIRMENTTLSALKAENNANHQANSVIHASVIQIGWHNADFIGANAGAEPVVGDDKSTPALNKITLMGCTLNAKEGEKTVNSFRRDINQKYDELTINGTAYSIAAGNVVKLYQLSKDKKLVDDNGKALQKATDIATLKALISGAQPGATIQLMNDIKDISDADLPITINQTITLEGNGYTLSGTYTEGAGTKLKHILDIISANVTVQNLTVAKAPRAGIHIYKVKGVKLNNITAKDNAGAGVIVNSSEVTATNLVTSGNGWKGGVNVDKNVEGSSPVFTFSDCSFAEEMPIYSDLSDAPDTYVVAPAGKGWVKTTKTVDEATKTIWQIAATIPKLTAPTIKPASLETGQSLSVAILAGGAATDTVSKVEVGGVFSWKDPAKVVVAGNNVCDVVFTPSNLVKYAVAECQITVPAITYYKVSTGICQHGKVEIKDANPGNKYVLGTKLTLVATPDAGYKLKEGTPTSLTVTEDAVVTVEFEPIMHNVSFSVDGSGSINVLNGATPVANKTSVPEGTVLRVAATPGENNALDAISYNEGTKINNGQITVKEAVAIRAVFKSLPPSTFPVTISPEVKNGQILLFDTQGNAVAAGSAVVGNTTLKVVAVADMGYAQSGDVSPELSDNSSHTVTAATEFKVSFAKKRFKVNFASPEGGTITISGTTSDSSVDYGTTLTATVAETAGYKLVSLLVNGKEIPNGGTFTVTADTKVEAVMRKLATIAIDETPQLYVYDGKEKAFVVKSLPAGLTGFVVAYDNTPIGAADHGEKAYKVTITRPADDKYAAVSEVITGGLVIEAAVPLDVPVPTFTGVDGSKTFADGRFTWKEGGDNSIRTAVFTPSNANYKKVEMSIWDPNKKEPEKVTLSISDTQSRNLLRGLKAGTTLSISGVNGTVSLWNGATQITGGTLYVGQELTLKGQPDKGFSSEAAWQGATGTSGKTATITIAAEGATVKATFSSKVNPIPPKLAVAEATYTGQVFGGAAPLSDVKGKWLSTIKDNNSKVVNEPINAGVYTVYVSCPEDDVNKAVTDQAIGTFTIRQQAADATVTAATSLLKGQSLSQSVLSGSANVDGVFTWKEPNQVMTTAGEVKDVAVLFTPSNPNYKAGAELTTTVTVIDTKVNLRTLVLKVNGQEYGDPVKLELNGAAVNAGTLITEGDKLKVTATPRPGSNVSVNATNATLADGVYTVGGTGNVEVTVTYSRVPGPSDVSVTGVSLNKQTTAIAPGETETLVATITPTNATNQAVTWTSSNEALVTVDAGGKVTAVKPGEATITVKTNDGGYTATCLVTVANPVGLDEELAGTRVYVQDGSIVIVPTIPLVAQVIDMRGEVVLNARIDGLVRAAAQPGIYLVRLSTGDNVTVKKISVR